MNILWQSNSPHTPTGYGNQTALFTPQIAEDHVLSIFAYYGIEGAPIRWRGIDILPRGVDGWGNDIVAAHCIARHIDLLITLTDVWVLDPAIYAELPWLAWTPIDHEPVPPGVVNALKVARYPVAMSVHGQDLMRAAGIRADYIPHGVDTRIFRPVDRLAARNQMGWDERLFVAMMNAANKGDPSRKGFREVLQAWRDFVKVHPNSLLYLHTEQTGLNGVPLDELVTLLDLKKHVQFADAYAYATGTISGADLNLAYNAADVLLNPSMGEGFGIPILEAQAAGCPVIVTDFSAMSELCAAGWTVGGVPYMTYQHAMQMIPSVSEIVDALRAAYERRGDARLRARATDFAQDYDAGRIYRHHWRPLLARIEDEFSARSG
jgi:glycosyltransferase involved in cell wall biosynthesis